MSFSLELARPGDPLEQKEAHDSEEPTKLEQRREPLLPHEEGKQGSCINRERAKKGGRKVSSIQPNLSLRFLHVPTLLPSLSDVLTRWSSRDRTC